jgi:putative membrane protein
MNWRTALGLLAGLAVIGLILAHQDLAAIWSAIAVAGWGLLPALIWRCAAILLAALAWRNLFARAWRPAATPIALARWIGESINNLLPVGQVGGDVIRGRLLRHDLALADHLVKSAPAGGIAGSPPRSGSHGHGVAGGLSVAATVVVDITLNLLAQLIFVLPGLWLLWRDHHLTLWQAVGCLALAALPLGLVLLGQSPRVIQFGTALARRIGLINIARQGSTQPGQDHLSGGHSFDLAVRQIYLRHDAIAITVLWHLLAWACRAGEVWLVLWLLGTPVDPLEASVIESLLGAVRTAAFLMPAGLGVQEGALILLCGWVGVPAASALALALIKRGRELSIGLPGLLTWMLQERRLRRRHRAALHHR